MQAPDALSYTDFRRFLTDWESWQRAHNPNFSHQWIQKKGRLGSRSHFLSVVRGRALSPNYIDRYVSLLDLSGSQATHFRKLVAYSRARTPTERQRLWQELVQSSPLLRPLPIQERRQMGLFADWYLFPLLSLLEIRPGERDHRLLAQAFSPPLDPSQVGQGLRRLMELGLLLWDIDAKEWRIQHKFLEATQAEAHTHLRHWHTQWLDRGRWSHGNEDLPQNLSTLTLGVSEETRRQILEALKRCRKEILDLVRADPHPDRVVQLNMHLFQVAEGPQAG